MAITTLSLLNEHPMRPYEMLQVLVRRHGNELTSVNPGSLYRTIVQLDKHGLVGAVVSARVGDRRDRTTYRITAAGRTALRDRITQLLLQPVSDYPELLIALSKSNNLPRRDVVAALHERIARMKSDIGELDTLIRSSRTLGIPRRYWVATEYLRAQAITRSNWLRGFVDGLETGEIDWDETEFESTR